MFDETADTLERDDFCSLAPIGWLHHKMQDAFFLVVGTGSCQGFLQTALGVMLFAKPRFATALLDEDDLGGRDVYEGLEPIVRDIVREHHPKAIVLGSTCTPEILKMNINGCAKPLEEAFGVRVYPCRLDGFDPSYTQGEDHVLEAMIARAPHTDERNIVILGCLSAIEEAEMRLELTALGCPEPRFLPNEGALDLPPIGPNTILAPAHPFLNGSIQYAVRERRCASFKSLFPYGPDGSRDFYETIARACGIEASLADREARAWAACEKEIAVLRGRPIAFASDAMVELPLARTLKNAGARITFVSTPNVYKKFHAKETAALGDTPIYERPDRFETFARLAADRPDCVVANLNIANSLEGMGFAVKWSTELTFTPIHGFSGAPGLFAMFTGVMHRHDALGRVRDRDGAQSPPIDLGFFRTVNA